jgi:hypothetical protein
MSTTDKLAERLRHHAEHSHYISLDGVALMREAAAALEAKPAPAEPVAWMFQHGDTGRMCFCANDGANTRENFAANNPRHVYAGPLYAAPAAPAPAPQPLPEALPPLPAPVTRTDLHGFLHTEQQMHDYALAAIAFSKGGAA